MASDKTELITIPRRKEPINVLTGVFLKSVYFLDPDLTKCILTGVFANRDNSLGVLVKGRKGCVFWSFGTFEELVVHFNEITVAIEKKTPLHVKAQSGEGDIKFYQVFGHQYIYISDGEHSIALNALEWHMLVNNLPLVFSSLHELNLSHSLIQQCIDHFDDKLWSNAFKDLISIEIGERLVNEISLFKRYPNGGRGGGS